METTDEKPELPEICKKYDDVSDAIVKYESDIKSMEDEVIKKLIPETGMVKLYYHSFTFLMSDFTPWITKEQWETDYKHRSGYYRLV